MRYSFLHLTTFLLACVTMMLTSCIGEEMETDNTPQNNFEALWKIIDEQYCFHDYKTAQGCMPWSEVKLKYTSRINDTMTQDQLFEVCCDMLSELRDGHVNLYSASDVGRYWTWHEAFASNFNDSLHTRYLGTDYKIAAGIKYRILDDNIGYIYYGSFSDAIGEGNLDEVFHYLRLCNGLIVDVRNNGGGSLANAEKLSARFTNERLHVGYFSHKTGTGHNDFSTPEAEYINPSDGVRWQKNTVVLTNRSCYSATNTFVRNMKQCARVKVMGDQTGGGSGMPFSSELPSGWSVRFSACPMYNIHMEHIEFGISPDTIVTLRESDVSRGEDTMIEAARKMLSQKK